MPGRLHDIRTIPVSTSFLTFTTLYPNAAQPALGTFVETRLQALLKQHAYHSHVLAPVPWFPLKSRRFGAYATRARVPAHESRQGVDVWHPRYLVIPKVGMNLTPGFLYRSAGSSMTQLLRNGFRPALIDAHYFYPDGVAAARLAQKFDLPLMITARGSDINLISQYQGPLRMMREAAARCQAIVAVSAALAAKMAELGFDETKITVLRNGVDLQEFRPGDRTVLRQRMGFDEQGGNQQVLLSAGNLVELKGHDLVIDALPRIPDAVLLIAGDGPQRASLESQAQRLGVAPRVRFLGRVGRRRMVELYTAADALVLASSREGMANVLLESIACGNPVIATAVGGNPEVVSDPRAGVLMRERSSTAIVEALERLEKDRPTRQDTRDFATTFSWHDTCHKLDQLIQRII
ncbi:MAG: glycosyltransferase family 4 protein [Gammaproteobacteria bacterium]|nr:glycosyltransferase family 4 protein [Gammaproteobacteria bacterium]